VFPRQRVGDYDNDGFLDLYVTNFGSRVNDLFHNNGTMVNGRKLIECESAPSESGANGRD
jgi:hypothetical protein